MKLYLVLVCFVAAIGGFLFGFDTSVISGAIEFIQTPQVFNLNELQKGWAVSCIIIGCMIGAIICGKPSYLFGRKKNAPLYRFHFFAFNAGMCTRQ